MHCPCVGPYVFIFVSVLYCICYCTVLSYSYVPISGSLSYSTLSYPVYTIVSHSIPALLCPTTYYTLFSHPPWVWKHSTRSNMVSIIQHSVAPSPPFILHPSPPVTGPPHFPSRPSPHLPRLLLSPSSFLPSRPVPLLVPSPFFSPLSPPDSSHFSLPFSNSFNRLPKIPETRGRRGKLIVFETTDIDTSSIPYQHKERESARYVLNSTV